MDWHLFHVKKIMIRNHSERELELGYCMLDNWTLNDVFKYDSNESTSNTLRK
jgi:hypothetical protein